MHNEKNKKTRNLLIGNNNTIKCIFDQFYLIPKDLEDIENNNSVNIREWIETNHQHLIDPDVANGKDGYLISRYAVKLFNSETIENIKKEVGLSQRQLAKKYKCSVATINKILKNKY